MAREILTARDQRGAETRYLLEVFAEGEHFASTLARLEADGSPAEAAVAPRFYGTTAEQARRRMIAVLENQYEDVQTVQTA